jgi:hypothetical protein
VLEALWRGVPGLPEARAALFFVFLSLEKRPNTARIRRLGG